MTDAVPPALPAPLGILAELTHRCPLACPYCSNPLQLEGRKTELDTAAWARVFQGAAGLGILQAHLSGGEPASRRDIAEITAAARDAGLYTNLITSGVGVPLPLLTRLQDAGLDHVQVSIQDVEPDSADRIAGYRGAFARKRELARHVVALGMPLTFNVVVHRANIARIVEMVESAIALGAGRVEIAHVQYYGWALKNRATLMPTRDQVRTAMIALDRMRTTHEGRIVIDAVVPDYYARRPKACMGGWGMRSLNVTPSGKVLPCHAAETIQGLEFWTVRDHSLGDVWRFSPAFQKFRGDSWMPEPCQSCEFKARDFGGCRCQALAIAGDAAATDPACDRSPFHARMLALAEADAVAGDVPYVYRGREFVNAAEAAPTPIPVP